MCKTNRRLRSFSSVWAVVIATQQFGGIAHASSSVTATQFAVTEGGNASVSIPLQVPRGVGGMEPQLTLSYSSGSGNGVLGLGWSLQGPSAITRCPRSKAAIPTDPIKGSVGFNAQDRFCLDGQYLVLINPAQPNSPSHPDQSGYGNPNSEYRTLRESFSRITAIGNNGQEKTPRGFRVETKSGLIMEFGNVIDANAHSSQIRTNPSSLVGTSTAVTINRWMLRRIKDRFNSSVDFEYCQGEILPSRTSPVNKDEPSTCGGAWAGSAPIHYIRYTNRDGLLNGGLGVLFRYDSRPDVSVTYHAGTSTRQTQRLSGIQTFRNFTGPAAPGDLVRSIDIYYEDIETGLTGIRATNTSRIAKIQERGSDGVTTLPEVTFENTVDAVFGMNVSHRSSAVPNPPAAPRVPTCGGVTNGTQRQMCP